MATLLYDLAGKLLGELCSPVIQDYVGKPWIMGTDNEFEKLKNTLSSIEAVLLDAEEKQRTNNQVRDWLIKIKLVFYDLEDLFQEVTTEALKRQVITKNKKAKKVRVFFSHSNQVKYHFKMGRKVKLIRESMDAIASDSKIFNLAQRHQEMSAKMCHRREETHSFVPIDQFIGRYADKEFVTSLLLQSGVVDNVSVISIVGIGGMGKTTLAQSIYNSEDVDKCKFELKVWVCVSDPFDVKLICENIIASATQSTRVSFPMEVVKEKLKNIIDRRKFLLVLDDVWNESSFEWMKLELLLRGGARGSKILITARAELVARAARSIGTHVLKGLSNEDSWVLFKQVAFKRGVEQVSPTVEGIGKEVAGKCFGVPLVVKAIGSMLSVKERETDWLDFKKNDLPRVAQDSEGTILPILRLSYDYLSAPLKRCFVFCAIYPKDHEIEKDDLIGMWMAHRLIQLDGTSRSLEDVGERHFMDLLDRSFFQEHKRTFEEGTWYKMHYLIHDLAQSVGGDEYYDQGLGVNYIVKSTLHAWVSGYKLTDIFREGEKLRTLVLISSVDEQKLNELTSTLFEQLRVLILGYLWVTSVPQFVGGLRHLYYLDLSRNNFVSLPESICHLYNLQTLILDYCKNLEELPVETRYLVSLRRLDVRGCYKLRYMPRGVEELTCLQTLNTFVAGGSWEEGGKRKCAEVYELKSLVNLRGSLRITDLRGLKCERNKSCILTELKLVKQLELNWKPSWKDVEEGVEEEEEEEEEEELLLIESLKPNPNLERLIIKNYPGSKYPSWMDRVNIGVSLPNIVYIKLHLCWRLGHVAALGLLPCLRQLHLKGMDGVEYLIDRSSPEKELDQLLFLSLKELNLESMYQLKSVVEPTEASQTAAANYSRYFPVLEKLEIEECPLFTSLSNEDGKQSASILEIPHLQTLELYNCYTMVSLPEWMGNLTSLQELHLAYLDSLASLPDCMQRLSSLQRLMIKFCHGIVSLPEWMGILTSLQELHLENLDSLASIPDCVHRLTSLQRLRIVGCPKLESRCEKETGVDWHKIAHIPNIKVTDW